MTERLLEQSTFVPRPRPEVFAFFADPANLQALTPPWLGFRILGPRPLALHPGARIDYRISLHGLPLRWRTEITAWEPPHRFVDVQERGPYRLWVHEHRFLEVPGGTEIVDRVRYAVWGGALVERLFVARDLVRIFDFRKERITALLGDAAAAREAASGAGRNSLAGEAARG